MEHAVEQGKEMSFSYFDDICRLDNEINLLI